ncbi:MAG: hypothetical protein ABR608_14225 [Pseudonocardiaceae bacterium]
MSTIPTTPLPDWQRERLTLLLDALDGVTVSAAEQRTLEGADRLGERHREEPRRGDRPCPAGRTTGSGDRRLA